MLSLVNYNTASICYFIMYDLLLLYNGVLRIQHCPISEQTKLLQQPDLDMSTETKYKTHIGSVLSTKVTITR